MRYALPFCTILLFACGNSKNPNQPTEENKTVITQQDSSRNDSVRNTEYYSYEGWLACKDCKGIKTTLNIARDYQTFELIESFVPNKSSNDIPTKINTEMGNLNTERGYENDPDATVYILNWDKPEDDQRIFVRSTGNNKVIFEIGIDRKRKSPGDKWILTLKE